MKAALLVGIDHYAQVPLAGCVADASALADALERNYDHSVNFYVKRLLSGSTEVTRAVLREQMHPLFSGEFEAAIFYFAGHGMVNELGGCVVTQDVRRYDEGISMTDILTMANRSKSGEVLVVLDCCHSGTFGALPALDSAHAHLAQRSIVLCACRVHSDNYFSP